jgi:hypothetical protein
MRQTPAKSAERAKPAQTFQDEQQEVDATRPSRDNEKLVRKDAEAPEQKSNLVDRVHGLAR